jgi:hypothetical protein
LTRQLAKIAIAPAPAAKGKKGEKGGATAGAAAKPAAKPSAAPKKK